MSYTHRVDYTQNILAGPNQGEQRHRSSTVQSAYRAAQLALHLNSGGVLTDAWTREAFTAHNINIWPIERELPELVEGGGRRWDAFDHDAAIEASL